MPGCKDSRLDHSLIEPMWRQVSEVSSEDYTRTISMIALGQLPLFSKHLLQVSQLISWRKIQERDAF